MRCSSCGYENNIETDLCESCHSTLSGPGCDADRELAEAISNEPLRALNPVSPVAVSPTTSVGEAIRLLAERNIGCVLVASGEDLLGIFSERDALRRIGNDYHDVVDRPISEFMTPAPQTLTLDDSIAFALNRMDINDFRHIPVQQDGRTVGIISVRDCIAYVTKHFPELSNHTN
jgi:CBS domain-containing protein